MNFAQCGAVKADAEPLIDILRSIRGVKVALILRENEPGSVRGSLRAKDESTDVSKVARAFEGGGHKAAAGFTFYGSLDEARSEVLTVVKRSCFADNSESLCAQATSVSSTRVLSEKGEPCE